MGSTRAPRINAKKLNKAFIHKTLKLVGRTLPDVLDELAKAGFLLPRGGSKYEKKTPADAIEHSFRNALAEAALRGQLDPTAAELPAGIQPAKLVLELKCANHGA